MIGDFFLLMIMGESQNYFNRKHFSIRGVFLYLQKKDLNFTHKTKTKNGTLPVWKNSITTVVELNPNW